ncbi:polysaccharide biosynthesis tyrosine autokinase, partial [Christiangramia sp. ASW11-125]|uniref:polysaccharide biosynthesis tyrosine autokinase n=1 Tax=Christiangramia sp. ASW11-125 TaxID=3400701 RepID=UPI003AB0C04F
MAHEDDHISDVGSTFDFKGFILKIISYWKLILLSIGISFAVAYYNNVRKLPVYQLGNMISIKDDQNPFFTSNTSLTFNWGGTSDKVNTAMTILRSRSHNEEVVEKLQFYINYLQDGEYQQTDAYGYTPFKVYADTSAFQANNVTLIVTSIDDLSYNLKARVPANLTRTSYRTKETDNRQVEARNFERNFKFGEHLNLPFFSGIIERTEQPLQAGKKFYVSFTPFNGAVGRYRNVNVYPQSQGSSVLNLSQVGLNKPRLVDYLNGSVAVLSENMLERKNLFATKTIRFIDSSLAVQSAELKLVEDELNEFRNEKEILDISAESGELSAKLSKLDVQKETIRRQLTYYDNLETYLQTRDDYSSVPAPSVAGINEGSIASGVSKIIQLAEERQNYQYTLKENSPVFDDIDRQINSVKSILLENINSSKGLLRSELNDINRQMSLFEEEVKKLPQEEQDLLKIQRKYSISENTYNMFLEKRSEAGLIKAANVSDVMVIDKAKDTGGGQIGPDTQLNYVMAVLVGGLIPLSFVFLLVFLNTNIHNAQEITRLSPIPILGLIGRNKTESNLSVFNSPKSSIAESFRGLRSSLQFMYKRQGVTGSKTVMITSSVSGEGKTFCAMNLATVFALSEKKTVLIGVDLRKPKIFDDFELNNDLGIVNYLIDQATIDEIIQPSKIPYLDVITSGPVPPNPSELLLTKKMDKLIDNLKKEYDYIILDTPPIGMVADALNLVKHADATLYLVRQDYTKRGMLETINQKYAKEEIKNISFVLNHFVHSAK